MAVLPEIPGVAVAVRIAGDIAVEYPAPADECNRVAASAGVLCPRHTCYVESVSGAAFSIEVTLEPSVWALTAFGGLHICVTVDGAHINGHVLRKDVYRYQPHTSVIYCTWIPSDKTGILTARSFKFAPVSSVDDGSKSRLKGDVKIAKFLGSIVVTIKEGYQGCAVPPSMTKTRLNQKREIQIAEKAMKGREISHGTSFSEEMCASQPPFYEWETKGTLCEFIFNYRSRDALQKELIIAPSPLSSPLPSEIAGMSDEKIRSLAVEMIRTKRDPVKREPKDDAWTCGDSRPHKVVKMANGQEVIDLTDD